MDVLPSYDVVITKYLPENQCVIGPLIFTTALVCYECDVEFVSVRGCDFNASIALKNQKPTSACRRLPVMTNITYVGIDI